MALERWLIDTPWLLEPPKAIQQNPSRWEHGGWMDVPVRIEEASYFRTRCKQRWEWVHGSKPVTLVRWQAGKAVNASRFPCASPSAKAEGSADIHLHRWKVWDMRAVVVLCGDFPEHFFLKFGLWDILIPYFPTAWPLCFRDHFQDYLHGSRRSAGSWKLPWHLSVVMMNI